MGMQLADIRNTKTSLCYVLMFLCSAAWHPFCPLMSSIAHFGLQAAGVLVLDNPLAVGATQHCVYPVIVSAAARMTP